MFLLSHSLNLPYIKFSIELIGGGKKAKFLLSEYNFNNISVVEPVSYIKSLELMNSSDYLLVIDAPSDDVSMFFPSKLADYIGTNKHILGISPKGSTNRILKELGYKCYNTTDIDGIRKGLLNLSKSFLFNLFIASNNGFGVLVP